MGTTLGQLLNKLSAMFGGVSSKMWVDIIASVILAVLGLWLWNKVPAPLKVVVGMVLGGAIMYFVLRGVFVASRT